MNAAPAYGADLAYVHHQGFSGLSRGAAPFLLAQLGARPRGGTVVDLGCGGGYWLAAACAAGYAAVGVDPSPDFLAIAAQTAPGARLHRSMLYDFALPACVAVTALGESLSYIDAAASGPPPLADLIGRAYATLVPGGVLAFDLVLAGDDAPAAGRNWRDGPDWTVMYDLKIDPAACLLTRDIVVFREKDGTWRRSAERHRQYLFAPDAVESMLEAAGFRVASGPSYGACELPPGRRAFIGRKPA